MENSTKALLIAAAVLIAIVIIALGVVLLKNASGSADQADTVGGLISDSIGEAIKSMGKNKYATRDEVITMFSIIYDKNGYSIDENKSYPVLSNRNTKVRDNIEIKTYIYNDSTFNMEKEIDKIEEKYGEIPSYSINNPQPCHDYYINVIGDNFIKSKKVTSISDPLDFKNIEEKLWNVFKKNNSSATKENFQNFNKGCVTALEFDNEGYVKGIYFAYHISF